MYIVFQQCPLPTYMLHYNLLKKMGFFSTGDRVMYILNISYNELSSLQGLIDSLPRLQLEDEQAKLLGRKWNKVKALVDQLCPTLRPRGL